MRPLVGRQPEECGLQLREGPSGGQWWRRGNSYIGEVQFQAHKGKVGTRGRGANHVTQDGRR